MIKNISYNSIITKIISFLVIVSPFLVYKYIDPFRANQDLWVKLTVIVLLFLVILKALNYKAISFSKDRISVLLFLFAVFLAFSILFSSNYIVSSRFFLIFACYIFLALFFINLQIEDKIPRVVHLFILSALFISCYVILHYYGLVQYFAEYGPVFSPIGQKNWTSNFLALVLPSSLVFYLLEKDRAKKYFYFSTLIIIYIAILICQSRGIWISILLTIPVAVLLIKKGNFTGIFRENKKTLLVLLVIMVLITVVYSTDNPLNRSRLTVPDRAFSVFDREDTSINMRLIMLYSSFKMIQARPLLGFGLGTFKLHYPDYQAIYLEQKPGMVQYLSRKNVEMAHNEYAQLGTEIGMIGLTFFLLILFLFYQKSWEFFTHPEIGIKNKISFLGLFLGMTIYLVHSLFTFPFHVSYLGASFFMIWGIAIDSLYSHTQPGDKKNSCWKFQLKESVKIFSSIGVAVIFILFLYIYVIQPYLAQVYSFSGQKSYYTKEDKREAIKYFEKAVKMDPYNGKILMNLGAVYLNTNFLDEAIETLNESMKYYKAKNTYHAIALYHYKTGNIKEAMNIFRKTIYLYPNYIKAYHDLASLHLDKNEYEKAIKLWKRPIELKVNFEEEHKFLYYIGRAYQRMDETENAYNYFLKALIEAPDDSTILSDIEQELLNIYQNHKLEK